MRSGWQRTTLGQVTQWSSGGTPSRSEQKYWNGSIPWVSGSTLKSVAIRDSDQHLTEEGLANGSKLALPGSILLLVRGSALHSEIRVGKVVAPVAFNQDVKSVVPTSDLDSDFLLYFFMANRSLLLNKVHSAGNGAGVLETNLLKNLEFPLPPLKEQREIAAVLGSLDNLIDTNTRIAADMERLLSVVFESMSFDVPDEDTELSDFITVDPKLAVPKASLAPYIEMSAIPTTSALVYKPQHRKPAGGRRFQNGDTVMARITPCLENGKTAFIDCLEDEEVGIGSTEYICLRPASGMPEMWTYFLARSSRFREYAIRNMNGTSGRQRCSSESIARYPIARPSQESLDQFAEIADPMQEALRELMDEAEQSRCARDTLLPLLMSGKITPGSAAKLLEDVTN